MVIGDVVSNYNPDNSVNTEGGAVAGREGFKDIYSCYNSENL